MAKFYKLYIRKLSAAFGADFNSDPIYLK